MNENDGTEFVLGLILGVVITLTIFLFIYLTKLEHHDNIIKHNCAEYNSSTGLFQWKDKQ